MAVLKAVADPTRFQVLWAVCQREHSVGQLAELVGAHVAAVSQHLARLRAAGLVVSRREGTRIIYRAAGERVRSLLEETWLVARQAAESPAEAGVEEVGAEVAAAAALRRRALRPATDG